MSLRRSPLKWRRDGARVYHATPEELEAIDEAGQERGQVMMIMRTENGVFHAKLTKDELIIIGNSLNEVCHGIDLIEFETRIGASKEETCRVLDQILTAQRAS